MSELTPLIDRYIAIWNETDAARRRALIAATFADGALYVDPLMESKGHAGIDDMVATLQQRFAGHQIRRAGAIDAHHDRVRFGWELVGEGGAVVAKGIDVGTVADTRLAAVTGFIDQAPA
jgi:hypothetical protein